jgi:acetate kinase
VLAYGGFYRMGLADAYFTIFTDEEYSESTHALSHRHALRSLIDRLHRNGIIARLTDIKLVVYKVTHGGALGESAFVTTDLVSQLHHIRYLSPDLPASTAIVHAGMRQLPCKAIAIFDTGVFHALPQESARYALSEAVAKKFGLRRYGTQGIMHAAAVATQKKRRVISVIVNDDISVAAFVDGHAVETSSGFTAAEGLPGLTRSGSIDPRIPLHIATHTGANAQQVDKLLAQRSGLFALTGKNSYNDIEESAAQGDIHAVEALMLICYRIAQAITSMIPAVGSIDAIIFCGCSWKMREEICRRLAGIGVIATSRKSSGVVSSPKSKVLVTSVQLDPWSALLSRVPKELLRE